MGVIARCLANVCDCPNLIVNSVGRVKLEGAYTCVYLCAENRSVGTYDAAGNTATFKSRYVDQD